MRIIKTGVALALLLGVTAANAAGLGKLTVNSALGQPLNAEIDLVSVQPGELDTLTARVAPPEAFRDARIEYSGSLRLLRFAVDKRPNGQPYLKVTSVAAINEPFLDVLVEVSWPAGRIQREYPILLDPPGYAQGRTAPPTVAAAPAPAAPQTPPAPVPAASSPQPAAAAPSAPSAPTTSAAPSGGPSAQAELGTSRGLVGESGGDTYGPVERGDTLRKIAEQTKPSNVSLEQMLVALYRENKSAFVNNNMNRLKTGQILKVPAAEEVEKLQRREVNSEIRTHVADWKAYREQLASGVAATPAARESTNVATGRVGSAAVAPPPAPAATTQDVLKLSKSEAAGKGAATKGAGAGGATQERLNALQEELTAKTKALGEANERVASLEKQIRDMQRLLDLQKSAPAPKTDTKTAAAPPTPAPVPVPAKPTEAAKPAEPPKAATPTPAPADAPKTDTKLAEAPKTDATKPAEPPKPAPPPQVAQAPKTDPAKPAPAPAKPGDPKAVKKPAPPPPSLLDEVLENPAYLAAGVGGLALLGLGAFMFMRRRRQNDEMASSMGSQFPSDLKASGNTGGKPAAGLVDTGNSSFLTDFDKTGPGSIDTDEVDPVAEAEVYIAYGRDAQAEEILKEAMARDRGRHEIALKLLEIYHARKSATAFETVAKELRGAVGENHPMWQKAAAMGAQIDPTNPLYAAAAGGTATYTAMSPSAPAPQAARPNLDFDLEGSSSSSEAAPAPDFDLDLDSKKSDLDTSPTSSGLDFDLAPSASTTQSPAPVEEKPSFDFDLSGLETPSSKPASGGGGSQSQSMDLADLSLDSPPTGGGGGGEAVGTKLELAKAYLEIGDKDGAREILQEVAKEGSSAQQEEAKRLISSL